MSRSNFNDTKMDVDLDAATPALPSLGALTLRPKFATASDLAGALEHMHISHPTPARIRPACPPSAKSILQRSKQYRISKVDSSSIYIVEQVADMTTDFDFNFNFNFKSQETSPLMLEGEFQIFLDEVKKCTEASRTATNTVVLHVFQSPCLQWTPNSAEPSSATLISNQDSRYLSASTPSTTEQWTRYDNCI